jgi:CRP-like cAMP-binding protein
MARRTGAPAREPVAEPTTTRLEREIFFRTFVRGARPPEAVTEQFVENLVEQELPPGAVLFRAGDPGDHIHYIVSGAIEMRDPTGQAAPWSFGPRDAIGGIDAIQSQPYSRTAVAVEHTLLLKLRFDDYFEILEDNFDFTRSMLGFMYADVEEMTRSLPDEVVHPRVTPSCEMELLAHTSGLGLVERLLVLREAGPWRTVRLQVLVRLAQEATERWLTAGESLFEPGQGSASLWFVAHGAIVAERREPPLTTRFGPGTMVLPFVGLAGAEKRYRAFAAEPSLVLALRKEDLWDVMEDHSDVTRALLAHAAAARARLQTIAADQAAGSAADHQLVVAPPANVTSPSS